MDDRTRGSSGRRWLTRYGTRPVDSSSAGSGLSFGGELSPPAGGAPPPLLKASAASRAGGARGAGGPSSRRGAGGGARGVGGPSCPTSLPRASDVAAAVAAAEEARRHTRHAESSFGGEPPCYRARAAPFALGAPCARERSRQSPACLRRVSDGSVRVIVLLT